MQLVEEETAEGNWKEETLSEKLADIMPLLLAVFSYMGKLLVQFRYVLVSSVLAGRQCVVTCREGRRYLFVSRQECMHRTPGDSSHGTVQPSSFPAGCSTCSNTINIIVLANDIRFQLPTERKRCGTTIS